jgi:hypothetical protein
MPFNLKSFQYNVQGELDTVVRDGPEQGRQWSRTAEVRPNGDRFKK